MELWSFVAMFVRRWRVVVPVLALSLLASFTISRLNKLEYEYTGSVVVLPKNPPKKRNGELVNPWNSADAYSDQFARLMVEAAGTEEFEEHAERAGVEADFEVTMGTEKLAVVAFMTRDESAEVARDSYRRLEDTFAQQLDVRQQALNAPPETWYGLLTLKPPFDPKQVKTRSVFPILVAVLGVLAATLIASFVEMAAAVRRRRRAAGPIDGDGDGGGWVPPDDTDPDGGTAFAPHAGGFDPGWGDEDPDGAVHRPAPDGIAFDWSLDDPPPDPYHGDRPVGPLSGAGGPAPSPPGAGGPAPSPPDWVPSWRRVGAEAGGPTAAVPVDEPDATPAPDDLPTVDELATGERPRPAAVVGGSAIIVFVLLLAGLFVGLRRGQADDSLRLSYQRSPGRASAVPGDATVAGTGPEPGVAPPETTTTVAPPPGGPTTTRRNPGVDPTTGRAEPAPGPTGAAPAPAGKPEGTPPTTRAPAMTFELSQPTVELPWPASGPVITWDVEEVVGATVVVTGPRGETIGSSFSGQQSACPKPGQSPCSPAAGHYTFTLTVWLADGVQPPPVQRTLTVTSAPAPAS